MRIIRTPLLAALGVAVVLGATACQPRNIPKPPAKAKAKPAATAEADQATVIVTVTRDGKPLPGATVGATNAWGWSTDDLANGRQVTQTDGAAYLPEVVTDGNGEATLVGKPGLMLMWADLEENRVPNPDPEFPNSECYDNSNTVLDADAPAGTTRVTIEMEDAQHVCDIALPGARHPATY